MGFNSGFKGLMSFLFYPSATYASVNNIKRICLAIQCLILSSNFKLFSRDVDRKVHTNLTNVSRQTDLTKPKLVFTILRLRVKNSHAYRRRPTDKCKVIHRSLKTSSVFWKLTANSGLPFFKICQSKQCCANYS